MFSTSVSFSLSLSLSLPPFLSLSLPLSLSLSLSPSLSPSLSVWQTEHFVAEQFKTAIVDGKLVTTITEINA
jgi:hypothetical protein